MSQKRKNSECDDNAMKQKCEEAKADLSAVFNECLCDIKKSWLSGEAFSNDDVQFEAAPFKHCVLENILRNERFVCELRNELLELEMKTKSNDLYEFQQSLDLISIDKPMVNKFKTFLKEELKPWIEEATGITLSDKMSSTCSTYGYKDRLLCHDDKCDDRRIAFIYYLNENWLSDHGGCLQLFDSDEHGHPNQGVKDICPKPNCMVFFEVSCRSYHQVCEVLVKDNKRLSVNGWFHGSSPEEDDVISSPDTELNHVDIIFSVDDDEDEEDEYDLLSAHLNPKYLQKESQKQISKLFEKKSEILLVDFLDMEFYGELCECLNSDDLSWKNQGPANHRKYDTLDKKIVPVPLAKLMEIVRSDKFFRLLEKLTQLELVPHPIVEGDVPHVGYEVQRWKRGFYTLLRDDQGECDYTLDVMLHFNVKDLENLDGGYVSYLSSIDNDELLTIHPNHNALAIAYRERGTIRFVKYIEHPFNGSFHTLMLTYYECKFPHESSEEESECEEDDETTEDDEDEAVDSDIEIVSVIEAEDTGHGEVTNGEAKGNENEVDSKSSSPIVNEAEDNENGEAKDGEATVNEKELESNIPIVNEAEDTKNGEGIDGEATGN